MKQKRKASTNDYTFLHEVHGSAIRPRYAQIPRDFVVIGHPVLSTASGSQEE